jgi:3-deoxy-D-manno-octulosonic-acid transferase
VAARGLLNDLYTVGALAYVGGGFRRRKLHATIEPAALGLPVLVGPHWETSVDAAALVRARGAVPLGGSRSDVALAATWRRWIDDERERWETGLNARGSLAQGAASRTVARLLPLLD